MPSPKRVPRQASTVTHEELTGLTIKDLCIVSHGPSTVEEHVLNAALGREANASMGTAGRERDFPHGDMVLWDPQSAAPTWLDSVSTVSG